MKRLLNIIYPKARNRKSHVKHTEQRLADPTVGLQTRESSVPERNGPIKPPSKRVKRKGPSSIERPEERRDDAPVQPRRSRRRKKADPGPGESRRQGKNGGMESIRKKPLEPAVSQDESTEPEQSLHLTLF